MAETNRIAPDGSLIVAAWADASGIVQRVAPALGAGSLMVAAVLAIRAALSGSAPVTRLMVLLVVGVMAYGAAVVILVRLHAIPFITNWRRLLVPAKAIA